MIIILKNIFRVSHKIMRGRIIESSFTEYILKCSSRVHSLKPSVKHTDVHSFTFVINMHLRNTQHLKLGLCLYPRHGVLLSQAECSAAGIHQFCLWSNKFYPINKCQGLNSRKKRWLTLDQQAIHPPG